MRNLFYLIHPVLLIAIILPVELLAQDSLKIKEHEIETPLYFAMFVSDLDKSIEWYSHTLGLKKLGGSEDENGRWKIMNLNNDRILIELIYHNEAIEANRPLGYFKFGFQVPDVRIIANRFAEGERPRVLDFTPFGIRIIQIHDPDGNIIQLSSPLETSN